MSIQAIEKQLSHQLTLNPPSHQKKIVNEELKSSPPGRKKTASTLSIHVPLPVLMNNGWGGRKELVGPVKADHRDF